MRMFTKIAAAAALAIPMVAASGTAQARDTVGFSITLGSPGYETVRYRGDRYRVLPAHVVRDNIRRQYREVSRLDRRGDVYVARAEDSRGRDLIVTASVYTGQIVDVSYTRRDNDRRDDRRDRWKGEDGRWYYNDERGKPRWDRDYDGRDFNGDGRDRDGQGRGRDRD